MLPQSDLVIFCYPPLRFLSNDSRFTTPSSASALRQNRHSMHGFPPVCPNFVIELHGKPGSLAELQDKTESVWLANGVD